MASRYDVLVCIRLPLNHMTWLRWLTGLTLDGHSHAHREKGNPATVELASSTAAYMEHYYSHRPRRSRIRPSLRSYEFGRVIGQGAFGVVHIAREGGRVVAVKQLRKVDLLRMGQEGHVRSERALLVAAADQGATWIPRLHCSFQDGEMLYIVLEYCGGGDLLTLLMARGCLTEDAVRFYAAEMILGLGEVHRLGYIHRDVKPDNFLFGADGHIKVSDFGLATDLKGKEKASGGGGGGVLRRKSLRRERGVTAEGRRRLAHTVCGTNSYMAPEVLRGQGYGVGVDWWGLGIIVYEALFGAVPFMANTRQETRMKILEWQRYLEFPRSSSQLARAFMQGLLCDPEERLGYVASDPLADGIEQLKRHPWFAGMVWDTLHVQTAPYQPNLSSDDDTRHFDDDIPNEPLAQAPGAMKVKDPILADLKYGAQVLGIRKRLAFIDWTFTAEPVQRPRATSLTVRVVKGRDRIPDMLDEWVSLDPDTPSDVTITTPDMPSWRTDEVLHWVDVVEGQKTSYRASYDSRWDQRYDPYEASRSKEDDDTDTLRGRSTASSDAPTLKASSKAQGQAEMVAEAQAGTLRAKVRKRESVGGVL